MQSTRGTLSRVVAVLWVSTLTLARGAAADPTELKEPPLSGWLLFVSPPVYQQHLFLEALRPEVEKVFIALRAIPGASQRRLVVERPVVADALDQLAFPDSDVGPTASELRPDPEALEGLRRSLRIAVEWTGEDVAKRPVGDRTRYAAGRELGLMRRPEPGDDGLTQTHTLNIQTTCKTPGQVDQATLTRGAPIDEKKAYVLSFSIPSGRAFVEQYEAYLRARIGDPNYDLAADKESRLIRYGTFWTEYMQRSTDGYRRQLEQPEEGTAKDRTPMDVLGLHLAIHWAQWGQEEAIAVMRRWRALLGEGVHIGHVEPRMSRVAYGFPEMDPTAPVLRIFAPAPVKGGADDVYFADQWCKADGTGLGQLWESIKNDLAAAANNQGSAHGWVHTQDEEGKEVWRSQAYVSLLLDLWRITEDKELERVATVTSGDLATYDVTKEELVKLCETYGVKVER